MLQREDNSNHIVTQKDLVQLFQGKWRQAVHASLDEGRDFKCCELMFPNTPLDNVEKRYIEWGGTLRCVLSHAEDSVKQDVLDRAISKADLNAVEYASIESRGVEFDVSQRFLPLRVNRNTFKYEGFEFASKYVAEQSFQYAARA